jgi:hypothetical protein
MPDAGIEASRGAILIRLTKLPTPRYQGKPVEGKQWSGANDDAFEKASPA